MAYQNAMFYYLFYTFQCRPNLFCLYHTQVCANAITYIVYLKGHTSYVLQCTM
jgi:hypothetical protein